MAKEKLTPEQELEKFLNKEILSFRTDKELNERVASIAEKLGVERTGKRILEHMVTSSEKTGAEDENNVSNEEFIRISNRNQTLEENYKLIVDNNIKKDDTIKALEQQLEEKDRLLQEAEEIADEFRRNNTEQIIEENPKEAYLKDACSYFDCSPEELMSNIMSLEQKTAKTTVVQAPIPDNSIILADLTPFEKYLVDGTIAASGCLNAKELFIDRFFMPFQINGLCDFHIRRMKAEKFRLAKQKFNNNNTEEL